MDGRTGYLTETWTIITINKYDVVSFIISYQNQDEDHDSDEYQPPQEDATIEETAL